MHCDFIQSWYVVVDSENHFYCRLCDCCDLFSSLTGTVTAIDLNEGRLRILKESAKAHHVHHVVTAVHDDLRIFSVRIFIFLSIDLKMVKRFC